MLISSVASRDGTQGDGCDMAELLRPAVVRSVCIVCLESVERAVRRKGGTERRFRRSWVVKRLRLGFYSDCAPLIKTRRNSLDDSTGHMLTQMFHSSPALFRSATLYKNEGEQVEGKRIGRCKEVEVDALSFRSPL